MLLVFFDLSKALAWVTYPGYWALLLLGAAVLLSRRPVASAAVALLAAGVLLTFSSPAVAERLRRWVEAPARDTMRPGVEYDAAVVLAGEESRLAGGAELVRSGRARYLLYSGRTAPRQVAEMRRKLRSWGVPDRRVVFELESRNTYENALESSRIAAERGWRSLVMVTSADHVERALASFRRVGLDPAVYPVERDPRLAARRWMPSRTGLRESAQVMHEVVGILVYRLVGYA